MSKDRNIGDLIGLGLTGVFTIGGVAAILHARNRDWSDRERIEACQAYYEGELPGYDTEPGENYLVLVQTDEGVIPICDATGIWFATSGEDARFVYDLARKSGGLPPLGALLATAHHRKAGSHYAGKKGAMRGFNLWGQAAGKGWREAGRPFYANAKGDFQVRSGSTNPQGPCWKFYDTPEESIQDYLGRLQGNWPLARAELKKKPPNPYAYVWYLQREQSVHGGAYTSSLSDPGGPWRYASTLVAKMRDAAEALEQEAGYNGLLYWAEGVPELTDEEISALEAEFPDRSGPYPLGSEYP